MPEFQREWLRREPDLEKMMDEENGRASTTNNRLLGLGWIVLAGVLFWLRPPGEQATQRRGMLGFLADMGAGSAATNAIYVISCVGFLLLIGLGVYQILTGRRLRWPSPDA